MKHRDQIVKRNDLYEALYNLDNKELEGIASSADGIGWDDVAFEIRLESPFYVVSWPEFVTTPKFNGDASYRGVPSRKEAEEWAD